MFPSSSFVNPTPPAHADTIQISGSVFLCDVMGRANDSRPGENYPLDLEYVLLPRIDQRGEEGGKQCERIDNTEDGKSVREISEIVKGSHSAVHDIIKRYKTNNQVENKLKKAHNKIFTEADERYLVRKVKVNPFFSVPKLAIIAENELGEKASPSLSTIRNVLHKKNLTERKARQKPFISKRNQKVRREFAKEHENKDFSYWKQVLFTDESKFNIFGSDGKPYVWRKSNEELRRQNLKPTVKHGGGSVMVWGSFSAAGPMNFAFH
ncbi:transposable element Tc1 transposase [Trichonephila clavipes]|nr:transposable element Tc1 transposase [Trichonephila clavipes]